MDNNRYKPQTNTPLLSQRDVAICKNLHCDNLTEYPVDTEFCSDCKKRLSKTVRGSQQFIRA